MKAKELKTYLNNSFKQKLSPLGFEKKGSGGFLLNENNRTYSILFNSLNYDNSYPTSFSCFSGFLLVEKILYKALGMNEKKY